MSYLDVFKKKLTVFADEMVIKRNDNVVRWKKWDGQMPRGVIGWKANAPTPGMESAGKCPTIARGGMGTAGIDWCIKREIDVFGLQAWDSRIPYLPVYNARPCIIHTLKLR